MFLFSKILERLENLFFSIQGSPWTTKPLTKRNSLSIYRKHYNDDWRMKEEQKIGILVRKQEERDYILLIYKVA